MARAKMTVLFLAKCFIAPLGDFAVFFFLSWTVLRSQMKEGVAQNSAQGQNIGDATGNHKGTDYAVTEQCLSAGNQDQR